MNTTTIKTFLVAIAIAIAGAALAIAAPAHAGWPGGSIQHAADDGGYNPPIFFRCSNGYQGSLGLGAWSRNYCGDTDAIYVGAGDRLSCRHNDGRWQVFNATGWHSIGNFTAILCYQQKD